MAELHRFFREREKGIQPEESEQKTTHRFFEPKQVNAQIKETPISSSVPRQIVKGGISGALGTYGDIAELFGLQKPSAPEVLPSQEEKFKKESRATPEELISLSESDEVLPSYAKLPTPKDIGTYAKKFFGLGEAESPKERIASKAAESVTGAASLGSPLFGLIGAGLGGGAGQVAREVKAPESIATAIDIGTNIGAGLVRSMLNGKKAKDFANVLYTNAEKSLPEEASGNAKSLEKSISDLNKKMKLGTKAPSEKAIIDETEEILSKIKDGKLNYSEAVASKRSLNEKMMKLVYETPDKQAKARARKLFGNIKSDLNDFLKTAEEKYPDFYRNQIAADEAFATIAKSKIVSNSIVDLLKSKYGPAALGGALGISINSGLLTPLLIAGATAPAIKSGEFIYRFLKSPVLRKHYNSLINSSLKESKSGMINSLRKINKEMEKDPEIMELINES